MKKHILSILILLITAITMISNIKIFNEIDKIAINTPAQFEMRQPAQQQTGQSQHDMNTIRNRNTDNNRRYWNNNNTNQGNTLDNYNRNPNREPNRIKKYLYNN